MKVARKFSKINKVVDLNNGLMKHEKPSSRRKTTSYENSLITASMNASTVEVDVKTNPERSIETVHVSSTSINLHAPP